MLGDILGFLMKKSFATTLLGVVCLVDLHMCSNR